MQYSETIINAYARHVLKGKDAILKVQNNDMLKVGTKIFIT